MYFLDECCSYIAFYVCQAVFRDAEKIAAAYKDAHPKEYPLEEEFVDDVEESKMVIANWDWLDFGEG
jgi:hypothetical protein